MRVRPRSYSTLVTCSIIAIFWIQGGNGAWGLGDGLEIGRLFSQLRVSTKRILLGDLWEYDEYCGLKRDPDQIQADDYEIRLFYNGTMFNSIGRRWPGAFNVLQRMDQVGIKARETLSIFCSISSWGYADSENERLADGPDANETVCSNEINRMVELARRITSFHHWWDNFQPDIWLQLNTFASLPSEPTFVNHRWLGDYDGCRRAGTRLKSSGSSGTRYCIGSYGLGNDTDEPESKPDGFRLGLCLPSSCQAGILSSEQYLQKLDMIIKFNLHGDSGANVSHKSIIGDNFDLLSARLLGSKTTVGSYKLLAVYCPPADDSQLKSLIPKLSSRNFSTTIINSLLLLVLPAVWLIALTGAEILKHTRAVAADERQSSSSPTTNSAQVGNGTGRTVDRYDKQISNKPGQSLSVGGHSLVERCFDWRQNLRDFLRTNDPVERLAGLNAVKVLAMNWLVLTHIYLLLMSHSSDMQAYRRQSSSFLATFIINGQHGVPVFFIISGVLFGYKYFNDNNLAKSSRQSDVSFWWRSVFLRYARFVPMYLLCYAYIKQFAHLIGSGPLWDHGVSTQSEARQCQMESWFVPLLMLANFIPPFVHCIITGWHIANDVQIILLLPLIIIAYRKSRLLGRTLAGSTFIISHLSHVFNWVRAENYNLSVGVLDTMVFGPRYLTDRVSYDYINPIGRMGTYSLGVILADLLFIGSARNSDGNSNNRSTSVKLAERSSAGARVCKPKFEPNSGSSSDEADLQQATSTRIEGKAKEQKQIETQTRTIRENFNFKVSTLFVSGLVAIFQFCSIMLPEELRLIVTQTKYSYPLSRCAVEIGWALLLYCLLITKNSSLLRRESKFARALLVQVGRFLRWPTWNVLAKLNYSIMLTHFTIARHLVQQQSRLFQFTWTNFGQFSLHYVATVYLVNLFIHLLIEIPLDRMIKIFVRRFLAQ